MGLPNCVLPLLLLLLQHRLRLSAGIRWLLVCYIVLLRIACGTVLLSLDSTVLLLIYGVLLGISKGRLRGLCCLGPIGAARQLLLLLLLLPVLLRLLYLPGRCMGRTGRRLSLGINCAEPGAQGVGIGPGAQGVKICTGRCLSPGLRCAL